ncbi:AraC family transcriptional regulator [Hungatella sp. L12]|uniref:AraC family transcriptional regulator n=2 Tax=Hungatella hominis TaxID=2763050 RepID=A0ABR7HF32_9FIRM|nr:AraC family transcriptional regulator [Hungatella hominis]MBC5711813.1 AraC family transcriptional regulator [Hungatella hominis]
MEKTGLSESMQAARNVTKMFLFSGMIEKRQEAGIMASELEAANYDKAADRNGKMGSRMGDKWSDKMNHTPTNIEEIAAVIDYIEEHLMEYRLDLESIAAAFNYSRYHLHRMFASVTGFPMHTYLMRRRLTEAARMLVFSELPVLEIALASGYETQRSFSRAFQKYFKHSPSQYRKKGDFFPLQLKYDASRREKLRGDRILEVAMTEAKTISIVGCCGSTKGGFSVIGRCWRRLHAKKDRISGRTDEEFLIGVNDYSYYPCQGMDKVFRYIAGAEVAEEHTVPRGMQEFTLPAGRYAVFSFRGRNEDSLQPAVEYIYGEWFPESTCRFDDGRRYDFARYGERLDEKGESDIQLWVPVI